MIVDRATYIDQLERSKGNGLIKIITGLRRSGKSFLLKKLFRQRLLDDGVEEDHIVIIDMESWRNRRLKNPDTLLLAERGHAHHGECDIQRDADAWLAGGCG